MTQVQAQTVASALIGAGYRVEVYAKVDDQWVIRVRTTGAPAQTVATFAAAQGVTANVTDVEFV